MAEVIELLTKLKMDSSEFTARVNEAKTQIAEFSRESESSMRTFGFGVGAIATTAIIGLGYEVGKTVDKLNNLYETSRKIGTSTGDLQTLESAFKGFGVGGDQVVRMVGFIQKSIGDAELGIGSFADTFKTLGLNINQLAGMGSTDQILAVAQAIGKLKDNTQQMAAARAVAGRGGAEFLGAVRGDLAGEIEKYKGLQVDEQTAENAHKFIEQLNYVEAAMESLSFKFVGKLHGWFEDLQGYIRQTLDIISQDPKVNATSQDQINKLNQLSKLSKEIDGNMRGNYVYPGAVQYKSSTADLDKALGNSHIPNFMQSSKVQQLSTQKVKGQLDDMGDAAEKASKKLKDLSEIQQLIDSGKKKATSDTLKDLLGDKVGEGSLWQNAIKDLKPSGSNEMDEINKMIANTQVDEFNDFKDQFQKVFDDVQKSGLNKQTKEEISGLRKEANNKELGGEFNMGGVVGAVNDLQKFAKEQTNGKTPESEIKIFLDPQLKGTIIKQDGNKITFEEAISNAAAGMGK